MTRGTLRRSWIILAFLGAVAALAAGIWRYGYGQALDQLSAQAEADLALASDRLSTQLRRSQELAVLMAAHPALQRLVTDEELAAAANLLLEVADKTAVLDIMFADSTGRVVVAAEGLFAAGVGETAYFRRAMQGALGSAHGVKAPLDRRAYYHAAPVFARSGKVRGALVVAVDVDNIESTWRGSLPAVFFTDARGEVFISNRSELLFWQRTPEGPGLRPAGAPLRDFSAEWVGRHEIWNIGWGPYLPDRALHLVRDLPVIGLTAEVLVDAAPAMRIARLQAATVAAMCLAFGALLFLATERRRTLARANAVLESRVTERTRALSATNARLRREIGERQEAEAALTRAQADLVQAGKLSALGQMSAGISHELNQPLMAIQSFAENGAQFLDKGQTEMAGRNLVRISDLAHRMGRIIKNLRAFARQESEAPGQVDIVAVIDEALDLVQTRLARDGVTLHWARPEGSVWVAGGEVRLGQVFINLVNNAADAMAASQTKLITVTLTQDPGRVLVEVADTGPGIDEPEKMFDPFYTTKEVGDSEGMGLGLSISYGLVQSFGGAIRGRNRPDGGAVLTVELAPWVVERVA